MREILIAIADFYSPERALEWTIWNAILWSAADMALCIFLLDLTDRARLAEGGRRAWFRWALFAISVVMTPQLFYAGTQAEIFRIEAYVCGIQFLILAGTAAIDARLLLRTHRKYFVVLK